MAPAPSGDHRHDNRTMLRKLAIIAVLMFGFGWALIPLYRKICDITGINVVTARDPLAGLPINSQLDSTRTIVVEFDANAQGPWKLRPHVNHVKVHPGELIRVDYDLTNLEPRPLAGQAIPSFAPALSGAHVRKLECFCFQQQSLAANETRRFPVVFYVDRALPSDVTTITLSYTFFEVAGATENNRTAAVVAPRI